MPPNDNKPQNSTLARLEQMLSLIDTTLTKEEFISAFEKVMEVVVKIERRNSDAVDLIEHTWGTMLRKFQSDHAMSLAEMKSSVNDLFVTEQLKKIRADLESKIDDKLSTVKDGRDGAKGERGLPGIGRPGRDGSSDPAGKIRDKLETLEGDDRLDASAIKGLDERFENLESRPVGGGVSNMRIRQAFKYIAHTEQPVGVIDGVNTTYTLKNAIWWIAGFTLNGEQVAQLPNFTVSGHTITFASAIPADYSGKDFECKYIG